MHLGCPVNFVQAAQRFICPCHGGVYDFVGKVSGGPPVRPLDRFYTRVAAGNVYVGPRFSVNSELERFSPRDPGRAARRRRPVPLSLASRRCARSRGPDAMPKLPSTAASQAHAPGPEATRARRTARRRRPSTAAEAGDARRRLDRRAHVAFGRRPLGDVPQGPEGDQLVLHARLGVDVRVPQPGGDRRLPGDVLRPVGDARLRVDPPRQQRRLPRRVRPRHAQVGLDRDGRARLPAHGPHVLLRCLQVPARAQLGDRRRAADPHDDDVVHGLPAPVRPALLLGDDRRRQHQRHRPARRPVPERLPARRA